MPGRFEIHHFDSQLLEGNALGDPARRRVPVYLPPGYDESAGDYPVLFALAGFTGSGLSFLNYDWYQENLPQRLDRLVETEAMPPVVVVMVDGMTRVGGNQYIDSPAVGHWGSHICQELVPWAERSFRLRAGRDHRGVFGKSSGGYGSLMMALEHSDVKSSGGYGSLMMALEHSDVFAAAASHSGNSYFEYCYGPDFPKAADGLRSVGGLAAFMEKLRDWPKFPGRLFHTLNIVAMSHFYSPNDDAPLRFDLPFDEATGERREDVFARWLERDPVQIAGRHADDLKSMRLLWIECGAQDEWNLHHGGRILSSRLTDLGVPHHHEEFEDDHKNLNYRYDVTLPKLAEAIQ